VDLETGGSISKQGVERADIEAAFADDEARGEFIILQTDDGRYLRFIQAAGQSDGPYVLEYCDESSGTHRQVAGELTKEEVQTAFLDYFGGDPAWCDRFQWKDLQRAGCLGVILLLCALPLGATFP